LDSEAGFRQAVARTLTHSHVGSGADLERAVESFVVAQVGRLPTHVRLGVMTTEVLLAAMCVAEHRRPFSRLDADVRLALIERWENSAVPLFRQYSRLVRSLVLFSGYEYLGPPEHTVR
jgi:hypothetical protein